MNEEILKRIDALAAKLGTTGEHIWGVLIRQTQVEIVSSIILAIVLVAHAIVLFKLAVWLYGKAEGQSSYNYEGWYVLMALSGCVSVILALVAIGTLAGLPTLVLNPEYWALQQVLGAVK